MPIRYTMYKDHRMVISTGFGQLTSAEITACMDQGVTDPDFDLGFNPNRGFQGSNIHGRFGRRDEDPGQKAALFP